MRDLTQLHPKLQNRIRSLQKACQAAGLSVGIGECLRTAAEQDALYAQGRTTSGSIVTNCKGSSYSSMHQWGVAFDFYRADGKGTYYDKDGFFAKVGKIGQSLGLEWGGSWTSITDKPHFQLPDWGSTATKLKKQYGRPEAFFATWQTVKSLTDINDIAYRLKAAGIAAASDYWMERMNGDKNVKALCQNIANYTLNHEKGAGKATLKTANDIAYRLKTAGILTDSGYWKERMEQDVNLFALGKKAGEWTV